MTVADAVLMAIVDAGAGASRVITPIDGGGVIDYAATFANRRVAVINAFSGRGYVCGAGAGATTSAAIHMMKATVAVDDATAVAVAIAVAVTR